MRNLFTNTILFSFTLLLFFNQGCKEREEKSRGVPMVQGPRVVKSSTGIDISYTVYGQGEHTLVFVHGWSCDQSYWVEQVEYFRDKYQVVTLDLGGHGKSGKNRSDWTMSSYGNDVIDVINTLEYKKISLIGHSMGSVVVMDAASKIEDKPQAIVFVDFFKNKPGPLPTQEQTAIMTGGFKADFVNTTKSFVRSLFLSTTDSILVNKVVKKMSNANPEIAIPAMMDMMMTDTNEGFKTLMARKSNVHIINSDMRTVHTSFFDSLGVKSHIIPETGHFLMMEKGKEFNALLEEILWGD